MKEQQGFLSKKSCISNFLECIDTTSEILAEDGSADILYLDFQEAFGLVPHKLKGYEIVGTTLIAIVKDFLSGRTFRVTVGSMFSEMLNVHSGVPWAVLGPLFFLLCINDLPEGIKSFVSLFADDIKLVTSAKQQKLAQGVIEKLNRWEKE